MNQQEKINRLAILTILSAIFIKPLHSGEKSYREVNVMDADQVKRFLNPGSDNLIVTRAGMRALKLKNEPYFKALPVWKYAADPAHREVFLRRVMRGFF